ncbi:hypothetical protein GH5_04992 [Leishmania sp. Ghana 2012 LV757]|uniref:hypothetical protein n=1 Tax=Leishmania sp. Ghana 2012 LV757 TaxID=2803181 RepID=UPI001B61D5E2|nr:hypothetical protein GH5_04992 [Leishmania sp. Ghana 2012 LV757]
MERYETIAERANFGQGTVMPRGGDKSSSESVSGENAANYFLARGRECVAVSQTAHTEAWDALCEAEASVLRLGRLSESRKGLIAHGGCSTFFRSGDKSSQLVSLEKALDKLLSEPPVTADELLASTTDACLCSASARSVVAAVPSLLSLSASLRIANDKLFYLEGFSRESLLLIPAVNDVSLQCLQVASRLEVLEENLSRADNLAAALSRASAASSAIFERISARHGEATRVAAT